jgi:glyoxylase-like metal-dependent hydrolase (beta-lactamase superfamily II)
MTVKYKYDVVCVGTCQMPSLECFHMDISGGWEDTMFSFSVIRGDNKTILINSGLEDDPSDLNNFFASWHKNVVIKNPVKTIDALAKMNIKPEDIDAILVTPLTAYTVGSLHHFPKADYYFGKKGWIDFWAGEKDQPRNVPFVFMPDNIRKYLALNLEGRVKLLEDEHGEVFPGIRAWFAGGHHRSSMAYLVDTEKGVVALTDGVFKYANFEKNIPLGIAENIKENITTFRRLKDEADIVIPPYDTEVLKRFPGGKIA